MSKARNIADLLAGDGTVKSSPVTLNQTSLPTSGFKLGDLWYDTDDDIMSIAVDVDDTLQWKEVG